MNYYDNRGVVSVSAKGTGLQLMSCLRCGALVEAEQTDQHNAWHQHPHVASAEPERFRKSQPEEHRP